MYTLPKDPVMLLSFVNMKLRDEYPNLEALCASLDIQKEPLCEQLAAIDYHYIESVNQFK